MSDLISRQAATKLFENMVSDATSHGISPLRLSPDYVISGIEALPSAQQWIPCSERLPQTGTNVLVSYKDNDEPIGVIYGARPYLWEGDTYTPIAWMPLPEPYKEK